MIRRAVEAGFEVTLIYIGVTSTRVLVKRIETRLEQGGHDVPRDQIAPRFERSLANLEQAIALVPTVKLYDNSSTAHPYRLIATFANGKVTFRARVVPRWAQAVVT